MMATVSLRTSQPATRIQAEDLSFYPFLSLALVSTYPLSFLCPTVVWGRALNTAHEAARPRSAGVGWRGWSMGRLRLFEDAPPATLKPGARRNFGRASQGRTWETNVTIRVYGRRRRLKVMCPSTDDGQVRGMGSQIICPS
jgi:hypothetical protein